MMKHVGSTITKKIFESSSVFFYRENQNTISPNGSIELLLAKRKENLRAFPGLWSGIGGKISSSDKTFLETNSDNENISLLKICAIREVMEEIGLTLLRDGVKQTQPTGSSDLNMLKYAVDQYDWNNLKLAGLKETPEFTLVFTTSPVELYTVKFTSAE